MSDDPNYGYFQPSPGSISGFDSANIPSTNSNIAVEGWSFERLRQFLQNQSAINFPTNQFLLSVETLIANHLADFNNPHHVTLDQIVGDFVTEVLGSVVPGTVPDRAPFYVFDARVELPIGDIFPATYTTTNLYRTTSSGVYVDPNTASEKLWTDYAVENGGFPLYSQLTSIVAPSWATLPSTPANTIMPVVTGTAYPFPIYQVKETDIVATFGIQLPITEALGTPYTLNVFIKDGGQMGTVRFYQPSTATSYFEVELSTGASIASDGTISGVTSMTSDGMIKVSFSYTSQPITADNVVVMTHVDEGAAVAQRQGQDGRSLFYVAMPQQNTACGQQPVLINPSQPGTTSVFTANLGASGVPATLANVIVGLSFVMSTKAAAAAITDTTLFSFDALQITRDQTNLYVKVSGTQVFTSVIQEGWNKITLSYSPTTLIYKDLVNNRQTATGVYPALSTTSVTSGPCEAYLHGLVFYAQADLQACVEYITNA